MADKVPRIKLNNGLEIPALGVGTFEADTALVTQAMKDAIEIGYRHIDCAAIYRNEKEVGAGINAKFADGTVKREDLFITGKLWSNSHRPELVQPAIESSLKDLGMTYFDLYLIHWPVAFQEGGEMIPMKDGKPVFADSDLVATWQALEQLVEKKLTKSIGIANFNSEQVTRILNAAKIKPVINQVECHPYLVQSKLKEFCNTRDIIITAYSPLGAPNRKHLKPGDPVLMDDPKIKEIATKHKRTPAQVALRFQLQRGNVTIPKSVTKKFLQENFNIFDFELTKEDVDALLALDRNHRFTPEERMMPHPNYPFHIEF